MIESLVIYITSYIIRRIAEDLEIIIPITEADMMTNKTVVIIIQIDKAEIPVIIMIVAGIGTAVLMTTIDMDHIHMTDLMTEIGEHGFDILKL